MKTRIGQLWQLRRSRAANAVSGERVGSPSDAPRGAGTGDPVEGLALPDPDRALIPPPEQPVLLTSSGDVRPVHVGELLPAPRRRWPLAIVRLPTVPRRAILAAGVCAGLAAPSLARHLATRLLFGRPVVHAEGVMEITRIVYSGPMTPRAAAAIGKVLTSGRR